MNVLRFQISTKKKEIKRYLKKINKNKSIAIVVARYNEDVEWTRQFPNVFIMNKGEKLFDNFNQIFLNNVGREGHSYYSYIYNNYNILSDYTIFLQGYPFDHSPNIIEKLYKYLNNKELDIDFAFLSEFILRSSLDEQLSVRQCCNIHKTWENVFGIKSYNREFEYGTGAQFIVSKERILQREKAFYKNIIEILEYSSDPFEGHDIERFHKYIFNKNYV